MLTVENGTYPEGANSYIALKDADAFCVPRGLWPCTPVSVDEYGAETADAVIVANKEAALIRAFDWLNNLKWKGRKHCWEKIPAWPRIEVPVPGGKDGECLDPYFIPQAILQAQCELAALIFNGSNLFSPLERGGRIKSVSDSSTNTLDVLSESKSHNVTYDDNAPVETWLPSVYPLLRVFLDEVPGELQNGFQVFAIARG